MCLLILESSTERGIVAISRKEQVLFSKELPFSAQNSRWLFPAIEEAFEEIPKAELQGIAVGIGPGSFTGIRVAVAAAKGLAFALGIPLIPLISLSGFISEQSGVFASLIDARIGGVYLLLQERKEDKIRELGLPELCALENLEKRLLGCRNIVTPRFAPFGDLKWTETYPDPGHLAKISYMKFKEKSFFQEGKTPLLYLREPQIS